MRLKIFYLFTALICLFQASQANMVKNYTDTLYAKKLKPYGRYLLNDQNKLEMISSAVHFGFKFTGDSCAIYAQLNQNQGHNYIQYEIDGVYQKRIRIEGNTTSPIILSVKGSGEHTIWIYKATEAHTGAILISKIAANHIKAIKVHKAPLIEFIGNSITCGAASDTTDFACGTGEYHDQHNAYLAYGPRVSRKLGVNYIMSSVSGIGIYRTWNMEGPSMPQVYEQIDFKTDTQQKWDFKKYSPKIVSIALGTNDLSNGDGKNARKPFDEKIFLDQYVNFIKLVKSKYPKAQIALLSSPMVKGKSRDILENCLNTIKKRVDSLYPSGRGIKTFFFPAMDPHGCTGHPSTEDHLILAEQLLPFYRKLLE